MILLSLLIGPSHKGRRHFHGQRRQRRPGAVAERLEQGDGHAPGRAQVYAWAIGGIDQLSRDKVSNIGRKLLKSSHILAIK